MSGAEAAQTAGGSVALRLPARDFSRDWRRFNLVANYVAEYASYFFSHKDRAENVISSVFYEMLGHMAAISREDAMLAVRLDSAGGKVLFQIATSGALPATVGPHEGLVAELGRGDPGDVYRRMLEREPQAAGLAGEIGLAMIAHDYRAALTTRVDPQGAVTLCASIGHEEISP
jgi:hypothetical protein